MFLKSKRQLRIRGSFYWWFGSNIEVTAIIRWNTLLWEQYHSTEYRTTHWISNSVPCFCLLCTTDMQYATKWKHCSWQWKMGIKSHIEHRSSLSILSTTTVLFYWYKSLINILILTFLMWCISCTILLKHMLVRVEAIITFDGMKKTQSKHNFVLGNDGFKFSSHGGFLKQKFLTEAKY